MDELRGIAIFCMVFYHAFFLLSEVFELNAGNELLNFFEPAQPIFAAMFIIISGISSRLSRSNLKRGIKLLMVAICMSAVTIYVLPKWGIDNVGIYFGILHFLSVSMIIFALIRPLTDKIKPEYGVLFCLVLYLLTYNISDGYIGLFNIFRINLPDALYNTSYLFPLGFYNEYFHSADYFAVFPHIFMFLTGTFLGVSAAAGKAPKWAYKSRVRFFGFIGRHTLLIYILHQPIIYGIIAIVQFIVNLFDK